MHVEPVHMHSRNVPAQQQRMPPNTHSGPHRRQPGAPPGLDWRSVASLRRTRARRAGSGDIAAAAPRTWLAPVGDMKRNAHCLSVPRLMGYAALCAAARSAGCDECVRATGALVASSVADRLRPLPRPRPPRCRAPAPDRQAHGAAHAPLQCAAAARRQRARLAGSGAWSGPPGRSAAHHHSF